MPTRCQNGTNETGTQTNPCAPGPRRVPPALRFLADSKALSSTVRPDPRRQSSSTLRFSAIGLERAITEMPAICKVFHPKAARREL